MLWLLYPLAGFVCGSIPFGLWIARARGVDIRAHGSGNIGATNVWRVLGRGPGMLCFTLDVLKGLVPSLGAGALLGTFGLGGFQDFGPGDAPESHVWLHLGTGVAAILGHMFTPLAGFKGGKGVATAFGALLGVWPLMTCAVLLALVAWIVVFRVGRMVGIASVIAAVVVPLGVVGLGVIDESLRWRVPHLVVAMGLAAMVVWKHRGNIRRTLAGTEPRFEKKAKPGG
ncbi:MAG: glycerol-3-phosphate 1-O-acyltransferase PlsY [Phycisphaeraceae bacterium]|nr:MAG: glycerol-3-phosphate 1-O-acyltransferase PlsY [Phycisphaeraceae bacterium]